MLKQGCWPVLDVPEPQRGRKRGRGKEEGGSIGHPCPPRPSHASQKFALSPTVAPPLLLVPVRSSSAPLLP
jgi:hypothetical protein